MKVVAFLSFFLTIQFLWSQKTEITFDLKNNACESRFRFDTSMANYYVGNNSDTIWFSNQGTVIQCNYMMSAEKSHNKCQFRSFGELMNGSYTVYVNSTQYKGTFKEGLFENLAICSFYKNNSIQMLGQYVDNWKIGFWTTFYENGQVQSISKFIKGSDDAVVEWEYDSNGKLVYFLDEEEKIRSLIRE